MTRTSLSLVWCVCVCVCGYVAGWLVFVYTHDRNDLKLDAVLVLDTVSQPADFGKLTFWV